MANKTAADCTALRQSGEVPGGEMLGFGRRRCRA